MYAIRTLAQIGPLAREAAPELLELLSDPDPPSSRRVRAALERLGPGVVPAAGKALNHKDAVVRLQTALLLPRLGPAAREAIPALTECLKDKDPRIRRRAALALWLLGHRVEPVVAVLTEAMQAPEHDPMYGVVHVLFHEERKERAAVLVYVAVRHGQRALGCDIRARQVALARRRIGSVKLDVLDRKSK